jgi:hypothetical protein
MTDDELTPERLDRVMDGEPAMSDDERAMLALAAQLRADVPPPSPELRRRIAALGDQPARGTRRRRGGVWASAPALGAIVVALVGGGVVVNMLASNGGSGSATTQSADGQERHGPATSSVAGAGSLPDTGASAASPAKELSGARDLEQATAAAVSSAWTLPSVAIDGAITDLREIARDRQLTIRASSSATTTRVELELPAAAARPALVAAVTDVLVAHGGVANSGPITVTSGQTVLAISLTDAR